MKVVKDTMSQNSENTPSDTSSVPDVMYLLPEFVGGVESLLAKCTTCDKKTEKHWVKIQPEALDTSEPYPLEVLKLTKRLIMCTHCGTLQLTN